MSQTSPKQRYLQFSSWLDTFKKISKVTPPKKQSRLEHYSKKGN